MHKHTELLQSIGQLLRDIPGPVTIMKIKAHAGHVGNEVADQIAKRAAESMDKADLELPVSGRPSYTKGYWLFRTEEAAADVAQQPPTPPWGAIDDLQGDLRNVTLRRHRLGFSNTDGVYFKGWQSVRSEAHGALSNGLMRPGTMPWPA